MVVNMDRKKIILFSSIIIVVLISLFYAVNMLNNKSNDPKVVDKLDKYNYVVKSNATVYYKTLFAELKEVIEEDEQKYAELVGKLFLTDFFTLTNKMNRTDVGGIQFVYDNYHRDFISKAGATIYANMVNNLIGQNKESLPEVKEVVMKNLSQKEFGHVDSIYDPNAYFIEYEIKYVEDFDYPELATLVLINDNNKLVIVEMK